MAIKIWFPIVALAISGCVALREHDAIVVAPPLSQEDLNAINQNKVKFHRALTTRRFLVDSLPIGSIVAYFPSHDFAIPESWHVCDGSVITDNESPLVGRVTPNLIDVRYLAGTSAFFGQTFGANQLLVDGGHQHGASTALAGVHTHSLEIGPSTVNAPKEAQAGHDMRLLPQDHSHTSDLAAGGQHRHGLTKDGTHNHSGDKRPASMGLLYIMKIK